MKTVLLPVKEFGSAKQRLTPALDGRARAGLARAMLADVLSALGRARVPERIVVFTAADEVRAMVEALGFQTIMEKSVDGHSAAINQLIAEFSPTSSNILAIAGDLPRLSPSEIDFALNAASEPVTLMPSRDWTGTNGILFIPPARISMEYGEGSFRRHLSKIAAAGLQSDVMDLPGIAFDIDTPEDLRAFMENPREDSETWRYLSGSTSALRAGVFS
ncbi:MAG TPA: 2-phospho-L-lactate guanylyltransferase [Terriglobia bacterium]|jgi:2-phospho-L-lactate guanylyltransferase